MAANPIIYADVPDPDILRVGNNYYMTSTTMHFNPGVPIMKSTDLVNWSILNYAYSIMANTDAFNLANGQNAYSGGSWASSISFNNNTYFVTTFSYTTGKTYIYKTTNIETGPWTTIVLNKVYHDHSLFFDDDGRVYMAYGHDDIQLTEMNADLSGEKAGGVNKIIIPKASSVAGSSFILTAEGTHLQKINGTYYVSNICWPNGSGRTQTIWKSSTLTGTYTGKVAFQSSSGAAQGEYVDTPSGKWYALFFQDNGSVGRIPDLMPVTWGTDGWPTVGVNGQVPATLDIPKGTGGMSGITISDEFSLPSPLKLQWQWNHNPQNNYWSLTQKSGSLRLTNERTDANVLTTTNTLTQRTFGSKCSGYVSLDVSGMKDGDYSGLLALQNKYGFVGVKMSGTSKSIVMVTGTDVTGIPTEVAAIPLNQNTVYLRIDFDFTNRTDKAYFYYSLDGTSWSVFGSTLQMTYDLKQFVGYRWGLFTYATKSAGGYSDFDFFRVGANIAEASNVIASPVVSITSPTTNTVFTEGDNITISASATITTGSISNVDFYNGTTLLGSDASSPYTYTMSAATAGNYTLTAKATSAANTATTSSAVSIQVAKPVYQTGTAPVIDGTVESLWNNFPSVSVSHVNSETVSSSTDLSGNWKSMWDATNLYVLVQVTDDVKRNDAGTDVYNDDNVEVYVDFGNSKATTYGTNDQQYTFRWNDATSAYEINGHSVAGITKGMTNTATGYIMEISIPWSTIGGTASINNLEGFEVMINDDDDGTARDGKMAWIATPDDTWSNPSLMGTVVLKGLNCTVPTATITTTTPTTFCTGGSVILTAPAGTGLTYTWKNGTTTLAGATASSYVATTAGSYSVTVTNSGGCSATSTATTVTVNALPVITSYSQIDAGAWNQTSSSIVCSGSSIVLGPQPTNATGWSWSGPNGYSATSREISLSSLTASQSGNYTAMYTDVNSCKASSVFNLTVNALPSAPTVTATQAYCQNATATALTATGTGLKWYTQATGGTATTTTTAPTPTTTATGTANYYVSQTTNTCEGPRATITVTVNALPTTPTVTSPVTYCQNGTATALTATGTGLKWYTQSTGGTASTTAPTPITTTAGTTSYYVSQTTNTCEGSRASIAVTVNALPTAPTVTTPVLYCQNTTAAALIATGTSLKWYTAATGGTGSTTVPTPSTIVTGTTNFYVSQTANGCEGPRVSIAVTVNALPTAPTVTSPVTYCQNATAIALTATGTSLKWYTVATGGTASTTAPTPSIATAENTNYYVSQSANGCESPIAMISVVVNAVPDAVITSSGPTTFVAGGSVTLNANAGVGLSYAWFNGTTQVGTGSSYVATSTGSYAVEVINESGCKATSPAMNVTGNQNQSSVINIISPSPNSTMNGPITMTVTVSDPDGGVTLVEFLDGAIVIGTSSVSPYSFTWNNPISGDHVITVRVTDSNGGVTTSLPVTVISGTSTGIHLSAEMNGVVYPNPARGEVTIETAIDLTNAKVNIINILGDEVEVESTVNEKGASIDVSILTEGTYILIVRQENTVLRKKITIIK